MLPAGSELINSYDAERLMKDPAELRRRVSELKEENVILEKRLQEAQRDSARLSATYRERQWRFLSQREPQLCASLAPTADLGAHLLLHMQATGRHLAAQVKEVTERAQRMEEETAANRVELETATEEADAFEEDTRRYGVQAASLHRRLRDASDALAGLRRHQHLLCERLRAADWALDLLLHDPPTRLLAADMMDAGPDGAVRIRHLQEHVARLESQLRPVEESVPSASGSRRAVAVAERELRVLDYEERDKDKDRDKDKQRDKGRRSPQQQQQQPASTGSDGSSRGGGGSGDRAAGGRGQRRQRRRPRSREARDRAQRLAQELAEQRGRARRAARGLAVLREEAEDLRAAVDKMRKAVRKMRSYDAQLLEAAEQSCRLVGLAGEQQESRMRQLRRYSRACQHVSASFQTALRSSRRRRTTLQSALRHSQLHLRMLHHIMHHLLPIDGEELPAHFYRGLVDASEKECDVLMDRMAALAQRLCRAKSRAQVDWQRLHVVRTRIQALEAKLRPYVASVGSGNHRSRKPMSEWSAIRERQLERDLQELREVGQKYHETAHKVESRYLQEMWALHHLFQVAISRLEAQLGRPQSSCASLLSETESQAAVEEEVTGARPQQSQQKRQEVAGKLGEEVAGRVLKEVARKPGEEVAGKPGEEVAGKPGEEVAGKVVKEVARKPGEEVAGNVVKEVARKPGEEVAGKPGEEVAGKAAAAEEVAVRRRKDSAVRARQRPPMRRRQKRQGSEEGELVALRAAQDSETCHIMLPACICPHICSHEPDAPCTILRRLAVTGRKQRTSLTNFK